MKKLFILLLTLIIFMFIFLFITYLESLKTVDEKQEVPQTKPLVMYDRTSSDKLLGIVDKRPTLSSQDLVAKEKLISTLKGKSGIIINDSDLKLEYIANADSFTAEVKNHDVDFSKQKAINYLKEKGLSETGICNLPLVFYLTQEVAKSYGKENQKFKPLPDFCI